MAQIHNSDTTIEIKVRKYLFSKGFRYRKNDRRYPGKPDIVLPKYKVAVFIHGCFWHRHDGCKDATIPKTRVDFWNNKFEKNIANDKKHTKELIEKGWRVIVIWECEINNNFEQTMSRVVKSILDPKAE